MRPDVLADATHILISFCNTLTGAPALVLFDIARARADVLRVPMLVSAHGGGTGIAITDTLVIVATQGTQPAVDKASDSARRGPSGLLIFRRTDLSLISHYTCSSVFDAHSLRVSQDGLDVVSTGTDEVVRLRLDGTRVVSEVVLWRVEADAPRADHHHLNGMCEWGDDVVISGFGQKAGLLWASAADGFIRRLSNGQRVATGIRHPHSPVDVGETIAYCESGSSTVHLMGTGRRREVPGYPRGMCRVGDWLYVGTSKGRRSSKSTGVLSNRADPGIPSGQCSLIRIRVDDFAIDQTISLELFGWEIYELQPVSDVGQWPIASPTEWRDSLILSLQGQHDEREATVAWLHTEVAQRDALVTALHEEVARRDGTISELHAAVAERDRLIVDRADREHH